jgi:hypothetical protein
MPIKRNENIVPLSQDHHLSLLFGWKIKQGLKADIELSRILSYVHYFEDVHLLPHFKEEEELLFEPNKESELVQKGMQDHGAIRNILKRLYEADNEQEQIAHLTLLADAVEAHVRFEERELFPALETMVQPQQLKAVGEALAASHPVQNVDDFADEFWVIKK